LAIDNSLAIDCIATEICVSQAGSKARAPEWRCFSIFPQPAKCCRNPASMGLGFAGPLDLRLFRSKSRPFWPKAAEPTPPVWMRCV